MLETKAESEFNKETSLFLKNFIIKTNQSHK